MVFIAIKSMVRKRKNSFSSFSFCHPCFITIILDSIQIKGYVNSKLAKKKKREREREMEK